VRGDAHDNIAATWRTVPRDGVFYVEERITGALQHNEWGPVADLATAQELMRELRGVFVRQAEKLMEARLSPPPDTGG